MATAMILWVRRRPHAERSGWFRLSPGDVPSSAVRWCPERDVQHAESLVPSSAVRRCVERDLQHADIPVPFSALRRCTERDVQHAGSSVAPGLRARSVSRSGPSTGAQVAHEDSVRCAERDVQLADTSVASSALRTKSVMPPFPTAFLPPLPSSPDKEISEPLQAQLCPWQAEYPMFQSRPRLTLRMFLSMNS